MKALLRAAAVLAFVQFAAHAFLLLSYKPGHGAQEVAVVQAMRAHAFDFGGARPHSYWEMYIGYGLFAAINCLVEAVLFWQLSIRPSNGVIGLFLVANVAYAILVWRYFFFVPLVFDLLIAVCLGLALFL